MLELGYMFIGCGMTLAGVIAGIYLSERSRKIDKKETKVSETPKEETPLQDYYEYDTRDAEYEARIAQMRAELNQLKVSEEYMPLNKPEIVTEQAEVETERLVQRGTYGR